MKNIINKIINSFDNKNDGFSARKLSAFAFMSLITYLHFKITPETLVSFLMVDSAMVLLLLGLVTFSQILKWKNGEKEVENGNNSR